MFERRLGSGGATPGVVHQKPLAMGDDGDEKVRRFVEAFAETPKLREAPGTWKYGLWLSLGYAFSGSK